MICEVNKNMKGFLSLNFRFCSNKMENHIIFLLEEEKLNLFHPNNVVPQLFPSPVF